MLLDTTLFVKEQLIRRNARARAYVTNVTRALVSNKKLQKLQLQTVFLLMLR